MLQPRFPVSRLTGANDQVRGEVRRIANPWTEADVVAVHESADLAAVDQRVARVAVPQDGLRLQARRNIGNRALEPIEDGFQPLEVLSTVSLAQSGRALFEQPGMEHGLPAGDLSVVLPQRLVKACIGTSDVAVDRTRAVGVEVGWLTLQVGHEDVDIFPVGNRDRSHLRLDEAGHRDPVLVQVLREAVLQFGSLEQVGQRLQVLQNVALPFYRRHVPDVGELGIDLEAGHIDRPGMEKGSNLFVGNALHCVCPQRGKPSGPHSPPVLCEARACRAVVCVALGFVNAVVNLP